MVELPKSYTTYLDSLEPRVAEALRPIFQQSAAEGTHGVKVISAPGEERALVADEVPFGEIRHDSE